MAYSVREAYHFVYHLIGSHGLSRLVGPNNFMYLINQAVNMVYNYNGYTWTWTHRKDLFNLEKGSLGVLLSRWPIRTVDKFWTGKWTDVDKIQEDECEWACKLELPDGIIKPCCECNCIAPCKPLDLKEIQPQNQLCPGQYQISGSYIPGMGGMDGRIVKVNLGNLEPELLWMTYYCGPVKLETFDDIVPLPDSFIHVLGWIIAALVVPPRGAARAQEDLNYYSLYRKELEYLKALDNIYPKEVQLDQAIDARTVSPGQVLATNFTLI